MGPTFQPALTVVTWPLISGPPSSSKPGIVPGIATTDEPGASAPSKSHIVPGIPTVNGPQISQAPEIPTGSAFTSTVFVTKKTPVPVVVPPTSAPPIFQIPSTTKNPITDPTATVVGFSPVSAFSPPTQDGATSKATGSIAPVESHPPPASQPGNTFPSPINSPARPSGSGVSNIPAQGPGPVSPAPTVATIDRVPVQVLPSSVVIGGQVLSIPASSSKTTVQVNGQTFTVQNSQIIAPGTTYAIIPEMYQEGSATALPSLVTAEGLTISVGASRAIIAGTTYAIGSGAGSSSTIRVGTKTVVLGSSGVILPSTTILPAEITAAPIASDLEVVTAAGLTFTIGPSLAIISGSTYTIGPGAKPTSIVVSGKTISVGSNGIGLASTTIVPEPNFSVMTVGSLTVSIDSSEAVIEGTTYHIGKGAPTETAVMNGKTISLGPSGVGLPSTTIPPKTRAAPKSTETSRGGSALLSINMWLVLLALFVCFRTVSV